MLSKRGPILILKLASEKLMVKYEKVNAFIYLMLHHGYNNEIERLWSLKLFFVSFLKTNTKNKNQLAQ